MPALSASAHPAPDDVFNQPPPLENYNLFEHDQPLREALAREGGGWGEAAARDFGARLGRAETLRLGDLANRFTPELRTHDRFGHRIDEVEYHPAWHDLMRLGVEAGLHAAPWADPRPGAHVARAALMMLRHQIEEGASCPLTMTFAVVPALRLQPNAAAEWEPRLFSRVYDPRPRPIHQKRGALFGMAMTERQGGSDVRANTTRAEPLGRRGPGEAYALTGHKWFCSAPMCDAFLVLAQAPDGLACFLLPRWTPDGQRNTWHILRLKDKVGNRSNASSEIELRGAWAQLIGEEGRGVANILEMVRHTRLDCALGSAASLRRAVAEAVHHAHYRAAFGRRLSEQPLMQNVLADLCLESEAATALALRLARAFDDALHDETARHFARAAVAVGKYWITKRAIAGVAEAMECLGGNGYVEEGPLARLYRDVPVNAIWEGSGNIQCLDVLRVLSREPAALEPMLTELRAARGSDRRYDQHVERVLAELRQPEALESRARQLVEALALGLQASLLVRFAPAAVADAFCAGRLAGAGLALGTLPARADFTALIERARPRLADAA
ncbi:MAG: isovaleryl-CoA dehydrogenase [Anaerolineales bacterium]|nr:isovaleryl-CoA dehydrogenase [Anaerolineales bacterium]